MSGDKNSALAVVVAAAAVIVLPAAGAVPAVVLALALLGAVLWRPFAGVVALLLGCFLCRYAVETGSRTAIEFPVLFAAVLAAVWLAGRLVEGDWGAMRARPSWLLLGLAAVALISFGRANLAAVDFPLAPLRAQLAGLVGYAIPVATALVAAQWVRSERERAALQIFYLLLGAGLIASRAVPELQDRHSLFANRADGSLLWVWSLSLGFAHAWRNTRLLWTYRLALAVLVAGGLYYSLGPNRAWVSGWLPPLAALAAVGVAVMPRLGAVALLGAVPVLVVFRRALLASVLSGDNAYSLATRLEAGAILLRIAAAHPVLGLGPANYYPTTAQHEIRGYHVSFSSHNNYIDLLAQTGALGLLLFVAFLVVLGARAWRRRDAAADPAERAFVCGALGGIAGTAVAAMLGDWVIPFVYNVTLGGLRASLPGWIFLGCLLAWVEQAPAAPARTAEPSP